jgi:serine/threonine protein kinase
VAPEVIQLKGASTASDIWSLGCTIVELTTGKPPYADLLAMSAMFRIVEDECPPIPTKASPELESFLLLCFAKDAAQRPSAEELCAHDWLKCNWDPNKDLRPQDSLPFLRRISTEFRRRSDLDAFVDRASSLSPLPALDPHQQRLSSSSSSSPDTPSPLSISPALLAIDFRRTAANAAVHSRLSTASSWSETTDAGGVLRGGSAGHGLCFSPEQVPIDSSRTHSFVKSTFSKGSSFPSRWGLGFFRKLTDVDSVVVAAQRSSANCAASM